MGKDKALILEQFFLGCLAQASYLVASSESKRAVVVDPRRDVDVYIQRADELGVSIQGVVLTHFHADFVAGHLELREAMGAEIHLGRAAQAEFPFVPLSDGDELDLGGVKLVAWETPGHTPESICLLAYDVMEKEQAPNAVLTGDTLFVGDVGRPDLMVSVGMTAEELAAQLHGSLQRLMELPDETIVYPGHGAGSMCGKNMGTETFSTIGEQRRLNPALREASRSAFIENVTANQPVVPRYFAHDAQMNRSGYPIVFGTTSGAATVLGAGDLKRLVAEGAQVLDVRSSDEFARSHHKGSINVGLGGRFAMWAGALLDPERQIVLVAPKEKAREAATRLSRVGLDHVAGVLEKEDSTAEFAGSTSRINPGDLSAAISQQEDLHVLDVRSPVEWEGSRLAGSHNLPLQSLHDRMAEVPKDKTVMVHCKTGYRSSAAVSVLQACGYSDVHDVEGGIEAWSEAGLPTEGVGGDVCRD